MKRGTRIKPVEPHPQLDLAGTPQSVLDLEVHDSTGKWPLVRGQWIRTLPRRSKLLGIEVAPWTGQIVSIIREVSGVHAGRVLVFARDRDSGYVRPITPDACRVRKPPVGH